MHPAPTLCVLERMENMTLCTLYDHKNKVQDTQLQYLYQPISYFLVILVFPLLLALMHYSLRNTLQPWSTIVDFIIFCCHHSLILFIYSIIKPAVLLTFYQKTMTELCTCKENVYCTNLVTNLLVTRQIITQKYQNLAFKGQKDPHEIWQTD